MKKPFKALFAGIFFCCSLAVFLTAAQKFELPALVVKQEGRTIYLDTSELQKEPKEGDNFTVIEKGEELVNPKTGKSLGPKITRTVSGRITQVEENYSVGELDSAEEVNGKDVKIIMYREDVSTDTAFAADGVTPIGQAAKIMPLWQSKSIEGRAKAVASGDFDGDGFYELALAMQDDNSVKIYKLEDDNLTQIISYEISPLKSIISLDAADIKGNGKAQLFASVYDKAGQKLRTLVLEKDGASLKETDAVNGVVKGISPYNGPRQLYTQDINKAANDFTLTTPSKLIYQNGQFDKGDQLEAYKFDNIFGFNLGTFKENGQQNVVYTTKNQRLRIQFDKRGSFIDSPADLDFSTTPNRLSFNNRLQRLYLSVGLFADENNSLKIAAVEHKAKLGIVSDTFGSYGSAKLYFLKWTGNSLVKDSSLDIPGVVYDIFQAPLGRFNKTIIIPYFSNMGETVVLLVSAGEE